MFDFRRFIKNNRRLVSGLGMLLAILLIFCFCLRITHREELFPIMPKNNFLAVQFKSHPCRASIISIL